MTLTIPDHDRRIERLKRLLSAEKNARKRLVTIAELKRRHADPVWCARFRAAKVAKDIASGRLLPAMTERQRAKYDNAKTHYGMTRAEALAIALPLIVPDYGTDTLSPSAGTSPTHPVRAGHPGGSARPVLGSPARLDVR